MTSKALTTVLATLAILAASFILSLIVSRRGKKASTGDATDDWNIGGRSLPLFVVIGTQFASAMGGGVLVGQVGNAYNNGLAMLIYSFFAVLPFLIFMLIGNWIRANEFETIPDMLGSFCGNDLFVRILSSVLTILVPFGWLINQLTAFAKIYREITGIPLEILIVSMAVVSILFVMPAGMKTVAWTDFFFACFMILMMVVTFVFVAKNGGSLAEVKAALPEEIIGFPKGFVSVGWTTIFLWIFSTVPGGMTNQMYFQRICAIKEKKQINKSLAITCIVTLIALGWSCFLGMGIRAMNPNIEGENATGWLLTQLPVGGEHHPRHLPAAPSRGQQSKGAEALPPAVGAGHGGGLRAGHSLPPCAERSCHHLRLLRRRPCRAHVSGLRPAQKEQGHDHGASGQHDLRHSGMHPQHTAEVHDSLCDLGHSGLCRSPVLGQRPDQGFRKGLGRISFTCKTIIIF
ncbi:MAG: sodium:solute symporter family protein [Firmicutes bacterium]|nr:sodium:solute symporter family protein [Bacillota bacterium]